jgi:hypothetical protein
MALLSRALQQFSLYIFLLGDIVEQDEGDPDISEAEDVLLSRGVSGARS